MKRLTPVPTAVVFCPCSTSQVGNLNDAEVIIMESLIIPRTNIKKKLTALLSILLILIFVSGCQKPYENTLVDVSNVPENGLIIKNWYLLGPFLSNGNSNYLDHDNLEAFNYQEESINFSQLRKISSQDLIRGVLNSETHIIDFNSAFGINPIPSVSGNVYAACEIQSDSEKTLRLDFTSDDGAQVWLNHEQILYIDKSSTLQDYENYIELIIKKGLNFLLIKVYNGANNWQMIAKLQNDSPEGLELYQRTSNNQLFNNFLLNSIIEKDSIVELVKKASNQKGLVHIFNDKSEICFKDSITDRINVSSLNNGLYSMRLDINKLSLSQNFFKGDLVEDINSIILSLSEKKLEERVANNIAAYVFRFKHLTKPKNIPKSSSERQFWQTKLITVYTNLNSILNKIDKGEDPIKDTPGFHIGTFKSDIDKHVQYYLINVPTNYDKTQKYPLMIFLPVIEGTNRPYLESVQMANQPVTDNFQRLADKYNICIMRPFSREVGKPNYNSILTTDFFEVLNSVKENYNIDTSRLYLTGTCSGGFKALELSTQFPGMFAAIGLVSPLFKKNYSNDPLFAINEPYNYMKNTNNIPIYILHSSVDIHTPVATSDEFVKKAESLGMENIRYYRTDKILDLYYWDQHSDSVVSFITKHKLDHQPKEVSFSTNQLKYNKAYWFSILEKSNGVANVEAKVDSENIINISSKNINSFELDLEKLPYNKSLPLKVYENNVLVFDKLAHGKALRLGKSFETKSLRKTPTLEGPFADALVHNFIIVKGTIGGNDENLMISNLADSINAMWNNKYFNPCQLKKDIAITATDITNSNIILLGNFSSNKILNQIQDKIPLNIDSKGITLGNKQVLGEDLGFYMVYPNPLNPLKYVAIIGYNKSPSFGNLDIDNYGYGLSNISSAMDISKYGMYDFKIWDNSKPDKPDLEYGFFSSEWDNIEQP